MCTGAKSEEDSRLAARKYARIVQKLGFATKFKDFKIQNMVGGNLVYFFVLFCCYLSVSRTLFIIIENCPCLQMASLINIKYLIMTGWLV